ncbi:MAG TPA: tRNA pseudouridine(38-40) synthase TruA [Burkholderiales bacterium]|nr:tRNA pseudouridine(38-40) synthase TruA [Burkholderiales bacterium]
MKRIAIGLAYDGSAFEGWQSQPSGNTVQDHLQAALSAVAASPIRVQGAGRTDAGVHACAQVAHFDVEVERPESAWVRGANAHLPDGIAVQWAKEVDREFSARFSAAARSYTYVLYNHPIRPALYAHQVGWFHLPLDEDAMQRAAELLLGEQDFSAFRSAECQAKSPMRIMEEARISRHGPYLIFKFRANAFLHHMVRNLVGSLVYIGKGAHAMEWIGEVLASRDRGRAAPTFPAAGLYLSGVQYPDAWRLPAFLPMMPFDFLTTDA